MVSRLSSATLACATVVLLGTPALAQTAKHHSHKQGGASTDILWKPIYSDNTVAVSIDPAGTIKRSDGTYTTHLRWAYTSDQPIGRDKSYRVMRETRLVDCKTMGTKPVTANTFDMQGKLISSFTTSSKDLKYLAWMARKPGSSSANVFTAVCGAVKKR